MAEYTKGKLGITTGAETGAIFLITPDDLLARCYQIPNGIANAKRLVACWNACEGLNPEAVPDLVEALKFAHIKIQKLCQELGRCTDPDTQIVYDAIEKMEVQA